VDNCFCSPALQQPVALGADLVMHSGTKYLDGQGRVMAGALCGPKKLIVDVFAPTLRSVGMTLSPFNAWVVLKGMETLNLRMKAQSEGALAVARWLEAHPPSPACTTPGCPRTRSMRWRWRSKVGLGGAVVSFDVRADSPRPPALRPSASSTATRVLSIATNLGDTKSIITHPASTSHGRLTEAQRQAAGIGQGWCAWPSAWSMWTTSRPTCSAA
jgi:O-succinylhomoserine sulfhydrylase